MLAIDVRLTADGGGQVATVVETLEGDAVWAFLMGQLSGWWAGYDWSLANLNGSRGLVLREGGQTVATVSFAYDSSDRITDIFIVRNPEKLRGIGRIEIH